MWNDLQCQVIVFASASKLLYKSRLVTLKPGLLRNEEWLIWFFGDVGVFFK